MWKIVRRGYLAHTVPTNQMSVNNSISGENLKFHCWKRKRVRVTFATYSFRCILLREYAF